MASFLGEQLRISPYSPTFSLMKTLCLALLLLAFGTANAQRIATKKGLITVDSQPYARFESDGASTVYVSSLQNERLFVVKEMVLPGAGHSSGNVRYLQYVFTATHLIVETPFPPLEGYFRPLIAARQIYAARLFQNGVLDPKAVADFRTNNGTPYSDRQLTSLPMPAASEPGK
jgi:hypothetical protein